MGVTVLILNIGVMLLSQATSLYYAKEGTAALTAVGYGLVPQLIFAVQGALNDDQAKFGQEGPIKYLNLAITAVTAHAIIWGGSPLDGALAAKLFAGWGALNGVGMYFAGDKMCEAWSADAKTINPTFLKTFGGYLASASLVTWMLVNGESPMTADACTKRTCAIIQHSVRTRL